MVGDHLFVNGAGQTREAARRPLEPMTTLATVATLSERLNVGTIVSNLSLLHPALVLRQFASLAALFGGERVLAGLGAGWNRQEFAAIGLEMPRFAARLDLWRSPPAWRGSCSITAWRPSMERGLWRASCRSRPFQRSLRAFCWVAGRTASWTLLGDTPMCWTSTAAPGASRCRPDLAGS